MFEILIFGSILLVVGLLLLDMHMTFKRADVKMAKEMAEANKAKCVGEGSEEGTG